MKLGFALCAACLASVAFAQKGGYGTDAPERYIQCYKGEIQILPALTKDEMPRGHVSGVEAVGGFVFDLEWKENKMTKMRVLSKEGGVCRIRSYAGIGSPLMRKAQHDCANAAIAATKDRVRGPETPESVFDRADHPLPSVCFDFDTEPGEVLEFRGVSGNQDWTDYSKSLPDRFLTTAEAARIAQNVLDWQLDTGGWPKNVPMQEKLTAKERAAVLALKGDRKRGTIDNAATFAELNFLARMYRATGRADYLDGVKRGIGFLLYLQYPNGGWPQCDPAKEGYWHQITFNDGAMVNVMNALRLVYEAKPPFDVPIPEKTRQAAKAAFAKGVACILKTQIRQNGRRTVWCQQHDRDTLEPCIGRAFELPACCSMESMDIVRLLMTLDPEDYPETGAVKFSEIRAAIEGARDWYAANPVRGYRVEHGWRRPDGILASRLVKDPDAPPLWSRYYTLEDNRPFTGTRQSTMNFDFSEMEQGENMTYMWFNASGAAMAREYPRWEKRVERKFALAEARKNAKTTEWRGGKGNGDMPYIQAEKDTWENPANWSNGVPGEEDTAVFSKDATLWSMKRGDEPYLCGRLILKNGANVSLRSNYEKNGAVNPNIRPRAVEGAGTITLCRAGLSPKEGETLIVPKGVAVVAAGTEGRGSFLNAPERGRLVVEGKVSCPGNKLRVFDDVTLAGELDGYERMEIAAGVTVKNPPKLPPETIEVNGTSLQSALDAIPAHAPQTYIVKVAPGRYREKVKIPADKCNIRFVATDPRPGKTVVSWNDTPATPGPNGKGLGTFGSFTLSVEGSDIEFDGFTIENTGTPERLAATGGKEQAGQCVALFVKGDRCAFRNCRILGWQDTVFAGGEVGASPARQYFEKCYIEGSVDFIFGGSVALFNDCELHSHQGGYVTAGSHAPDLPFGYVFVKCRVTCGGGKQTSLGRPWRPFANVTFVASDFGTAVAPHGWNDWTTDCGRRVYRSAEYGCTHKGDYRREPWIEVGSLAAFKKRLVAAGLATIPDILKGADDWRPIQ